jgi:hypothetical protein
MLPDLIVAGGYTRNRFFVTYPCYKELACKALLTLSVARFEKEKYQLVPLQLTDILHGEACVKFVLGLTNTTIIRNVIYTMGFVFSNFTVIFVESDFTTVVGEFVGCENMIHMSDALTIETLLGFDRRIMDIINQVFDEHMDANRENMRPTRYPNTPQTNPSDYIDLDECEVLKQISV